MKKCVLHIGIAVVLIISLIYINNCFTVQARSTKATDHETPLVIAHRGGASLAPENTLVAFQKARLIGVDAIELDIRMSKDGHLVVIHDESVDRTTNGNGKVNKLTLRKLKKLDAGYHFKDKFGDHIYRGKGIKIPTLEEVFESYNDMHLILEIKDAEPSRRGSKLEKKLWKLIKKYDLEDNVLVFSFHEDILNRFNRYAKGQVALGASKEEAQRFVIFHKLFLNNLYKPSSNALVIPTERNNVRLTDRRLIRGSHNLDMKVHYWTINNEKQMKELLKRGADGIITDRPDLLLKIIEKMKKKFKKSEETE
jgi:glycerophosphoryl diester phosphodiesterase